MEQKYLTRIKAAEYINNMTGIQTTHKSLASMSTRGVGPKFQKFGSHVLYEIADIDAWIQSKMSKKVEKTSELKVA